MRRIALLLGLALPLFARADGPATASIRFPPRPRLGRAPAASGDAARASLTAQADRLLAGPPTVPDREGNWVYYYACPAEGARLQADSETRHHCPVCKRVFTDARTAAAYRTVLYYRLEAELKTLARAYALTGRAAYAEAVRDALLKMARAWPTFPRHDRWGRTGILAVVGGRRFAQLLDEATSLINLAEAWDLIADAPAVSDTDRALIEKQLFQMPVAEIDRYEWFVGSRNNHQSWFNAAKAVVGLVLGDEAMLRRALWGKAGLLWQVEHSVIDGIWYEGSLAYHFYALQAIQHTLEAADRAGVSFRDHPILPTLWSGPLQLSYPNGQTPVFHDSDPISLAHYQSIFAWGAAYFNDPALAAGSPTGLASTNLARLGLAILRRGAGENASCLMLDYGEHGDHHGHPDKLNIALFALGRELLVDPGRLSYSLPEYESWCRTTVAHNTVTVGSRNQRSDTGRLLFYADTPDAAAALALSDGAYPGATLRRFVVLANDLLVDAVAVRDAFPMQIDWIVHGRGGLTGPTNLTIRLKPLGERDGYPHLANLQDGVCSRGPVPFTFTLDSGALWRLWCVNADFRTRLVSGTGIGYRLNDAVPFVLQRRMAEHTLFLNVFDLSGSGAIAQVESLPVTDSRGATIPETEAAALRITGSDGSCRLVALDLDPKGDRTLSVDGKSFVRWLFSKTIDCETNKPPL